VNAARGADTPRYAELHCLSNFSFLRGASHAEELVMQAKALGLAGIGVADRNTLAGMVRAHAAAKEYDVRLAVGVRLAFRDGTPDILVYPQDRAAYARLTRLLTIGNRRAPKGECWLDFADFLEHGEGLLAIVMPYASHAGACLRQAQASAVASKACHSSLRYSISARFSSSERPANSLSWP
jgi:error-prone DNA polymerase